MPNVRNGQSAMSSKGIREIFSERSRIIEDPALYFSHKTLEDNGFSEDRNVFGERIRKTIEVAEQTIIGQTKILAKSYHAVTGEGIIKGWNTFTPQDLARAVFHADFALLHDSGKGRPKFDYGNAMALKLLGRNLKQLKGMHSEQTTVPGPDRHEREELLLKVKRDGVYKGACGNRVTHRGKRFSIDDAVVWTVKDGPVVFGHAALIRGWSFYDTMRS